MSERKKEKNTSIFIEDLEIFRQLRGDIRSLWFQKYGENLTYGEIIIKSMAAFKEDLIHGKVKKSFYIEDFYSRLIR